MSCEDNHKYQSEHVATPWGVRLRTLRDLFGALTAQDKSGRSLHRACLFAAPVLFGLLASVLPPDANFDLANYHYYIPWAFLTDRYARDFLPSGVPTFYNPLIDIPFFWANTHLPGRVVAFLLGLWHGACFVLLYLLGRTLLFRDTNWRNIAAAAAVAAAGVGAAVSIAELGTTYYDYIGAAGMFLCLQLLARHTVERPASLWPVALAGLVLGAVAGLKLTNLPLAAGVGLAVPFLYQPSLRRRLDMTGAFAGGGLAGFFTAGGEWMIHLWRNYGNPIFPYFNEVFHSSFVPPDFSRDMRFLPHGWLETLSYPFVFTFDPQRTIEVPMRDFRFLALFLAVPLGAVLLAVTRHAAARTAEQTARRRYLVFLFVALGASYVFWLILFSIRRYALALEMIAPLAIVLIAMELPRARKLTAAVLVGALVVTTLPRTLGRSDWHGWNGRIVDVRLPMRIPDDSMILMTGWRPTSFVAPSFPADDSFVNVRLALRFANGPRLKHLVRRIAAHRGPFLALSHSTEMKSLDTLRRFGLRAGRCRTIRSTLDLKGPLELCDVSRGIRTHYAAKRR